MEALFFISAVIWVTLLITMLAEGSMSGNKAKMAISGLLWVALLSIWLGSTEPTYQRALMVECESVAYYHDTDRNALVAIPSNATKVIKKTSRWGSISEPRYIVKYE